MIGSATAQAVSRWLPTAAARVQTRGLVMWDLCWTKWRWGRFSPSTSVSPMSRDSAVGIATGYGLDDMEK
jgi:hypothetical protein